MIEINLIAKKKKIKAPIILGVDFSLLPWKSIFFALVFQSYVPDYVSEIWKKEKDDVVAEMNILRKEESELRLKLRKNKNVEKLLDAFSSQIRKLEKRSSFVDKLIKERTNPHLVLEKIARSTPKDVWFRELLINTKKEITIKGGSNNYKSIGDFIVEANNSPFFDNSLQLANSKTEQEKVQNTEVRTESFEIKGVIKLYDPFKQ